MAFNRLTKVLSRVKKIFAPVHKGSIDEIEEILLRADVGVKYTHRIIEEIKKSRKDPVTALKAELYKYINIPLPRPEDTAPMVIMVSGVNGSGKTTTVAKLAYLHLKNSRVILASADTYRDAANEQLSFWAAKTGVELVASQKGQDAGAVVYDAISKAQARNFNTVIVDTAGRLHTRTDLMAELKKIVRVVKKLLNKEPDFNLLTIDATLGQNSIQQARIFTQEIAINGLVLTKFDGTAKGGAIIPICQELNLPVLYLGVGERIEDLVPFDPRAFIDALFD